MNKNDRDRDAAEHARIRAVAAEQVLSNPLYKEAITALKADLFTKFQNTNWLQVKERTEIWRTLKNLGNLEQYLTRTITTGKLSK
jgi:hypothetical protein